MENDRVGSIVQSLRTGETKEINESIRRIKEIWHLYIDEKWQRRKGKEATNDLMLLRDELAKMTKDDDWKMRYAALRGLRALAISEVFDEKIGDMISIFLKTISDEDGRVRSATVHTFGWMRPMEGKFTDDMYVELYITLQGMLDGEENAKKRASIEQALGSLFCPYLDDLLRERGYVPV